MKKHLFSAALLTATTALSFPAFAQTAKTEVSNHPIELQVGGYMTWYGAYGSQRKETFGVGNYNHVDLIGDAEIYFSGKTKLDNGVEIGAMVQLEAGTDSDTSDQVIDETYMTVDSKIGRVIVGNVKNVSNQMSVTAPTVSTLGEQETDFRRIIAVPNGFYYNKATYAVLDDISTKMSYITPTFGDLTFGVSLMPGNKQKGKDSNTLLRNDGRRKPFRYGADAAALFEHDFGGFNLSASATYTVYKPNFHANNVDLKEKEINEYGGGLNIGIGNWTIGGSYHYTNMSRETAAQMHDIWNQTIAKGHAWDAGVKYTVGPVETSLTVLQSRADNLAFRNKKDIYTQYQLSGKYNMMKGVNAFMDVAYMDFKSALEDKRQSNKGPAVAIGMDLSF